jgi:hypothetical protein
VIYRRERKDMPAIREETEAAEARGREVRLPGRAAPHRRRRRRQRQGHRSGEDALGEFDASGRRRPVPTGRDDPLRCDTVILAVGETVDQDFCAPAA